MNIGLFGGTFNPFHNGHLEISRYVQKKYNLNKIVFIPSAMPPHKPGNNLAQAKDRYDMVKCSIADFQGFEISDKEFSRQGPSFTIDTISEFKTEGGKHTNFFLIMGSDAFLDIPTWKQTEKIFTSIPIIIMLRGGNDTPDIIATFIDEHISKGYTLNRSTHEFTHEQKQTISICMVPKIDISSTMIRDRIKNDLPIQGFVPLAVEAVIKAKDLYK